MKNSVNVTLLFALAILLVMAMSAAAQAPNSIIYQGRLTDADGNAITDSTDVKFEIFAALTGGSNIYNITQKVGPDGNGVFTVELTGVTSTVLNGSKRYLQLTVGTDVLSPRQLLTSAPYAYSAEYADNIPDNSVTTSKIAASGVTNSDIASNAVTGAKVSNGSLTDADILDEPGLAFNASEPGNTYRNMPSLTEPIDSITITVPAAGYIYVWAHATFRISHTNGIKDEVHLQVSPVRGIIDYGDFGFGFVVLPNVVATGDYIYPVNVHRAFYVSSSGAYKYYANSRMFSGADADDDFFNLQITAFYFPTAYGTVDQPTKSSGGNDNLLPTGVASPDEDK